MSTVIEYVKKGLREVFYELSDFFTLKNHPYHVVWSEYNQKFWVINQDGDIVYRSASKADCTRFIKMNTRF